VKSQRLKVCSSLDGPIHLVIHLMEFLEEVVVAIGLALLVLLLDPAHDHGHGREPTAVHWVFAWMQSPTQLPGGALSLMGQTLLVPRHEGVLGHDKIAINRCSEIRRAQTQRSFLLLPPDFKIFIQLIMLGELACICIRTAPLAFGLVMHGTKLLVLHDVVIVGVYRAILLELVWHFLLRAGPLEPMAALDADFGNDGADVVALHAA